MKTSQPNTFVDCRVSFAFFILAITLGAPFVTAEEPSEFLGTFDNNKIAITIRSADGGFAGLIRQGSESLPFKASIKKNKLVGTFMKEGAAYAFSARMIKDDLEVTLGLQSSNLRRKSEQSEFVGTFRAKELAIVVKKTRGRFHGQFIQGKEAVEFLGLLDKGKLRGEFTKDDVKYLFTAALNGNKLKLTFGLQSFDLDRVKGNPLVGDDQTPNTARRRVLLADGKDLVTGSVLVSPDNRSVAYITQKESKRRVVINGLAGNPYYRVNLWEFSPNSHRLAYLASKGRQYQLIFGDKTTELFDGFQFKRGIFSANGNRIAVAGQQGKNWFIVVDGMKEQTPYEAIAGVTFSPDGKRLAYAGQRNRKWSFVIDGKARGSFDAIGLGPQPFSHDGRRYSLAFHRDGKQHVMIDGEESRPYDVVTHGVFSPDGKRFAFNAVRSNRHVAVENGAEGKAYDQMEALKFSPDGSKLAYAARRDAQWMVVVNGKEGAPFNIVSAPQFSIDGLHMAYIARRGKEMIVVRDENVVADHTDIRGLVMSLDGKRLAYAAKNPEGGWQVFTDATATRAFSEQPRGLTFSPDGKHLVFVVQAGNDWHIVVDGVAGNHVGEWLPGGQLVFDSPTKFHTVVRDGDPFYRLDVEILN